MHAMVLSLQGAAQVFIFHYSSGILSLQSIGICEKGLWSISYTKTYLGGHFFVAKRVYPGSKDKHLPKLEEKKN